MQRLRKLHRRQDDERGAVSVVVALLSVALIGFAAVSIDLAAVWADKQQLQTGADAAALAIAQDCANGDCGSPSITAQVLAESNKNECGGEPDGDCNVMTSVSGPTGGTVTVTASRVREHWFAPVLGIDESPVNATAVARWGSPIAGVAPLPIIFSECEWYAQTGLEPLGEGAPAEELVISLPKNSGELGCNKPVSGNFVPGGFGYVDPIPGTCSAETSLSSLASSSGGNTTPASCSNSDFQAIVNSDEPILIPLFDDQGGTGTNAWYQVSGYAAFKLTGYMLGGQDKTSPAPCGGSDRCISGYFLEYVDVSGDLLTGPSAPDFGASAARLIIPDIE